MFSQAEIDVLKQKSIVGYLDSIGMKPTKRTHGKVIRYISPFREEKEGSFYVYPATNTWNDFGAGKGGSIIQLVMECEKVSFRKACEILSEGKIKEREALPPRQNEEPAIKILYSCEIKSGWLKQFLSYRAIPLDIASKYCKQLRIELKRDDGSTYRKTVIGFPSDKKGWEMRNAKTKISNSPKYLSTINPGKSKAFVVEGFFDMLSLLTLYGYRDDYTYIVLNSASFVSYLPAKSFDFIVYLSDRDVAGDRVLEELKKETKVYDKRYIFAPHKDLNAYLMAKRERGLYKRELLQML
jgi:hypothetical protein